MKNITSSFIFFFIFTITLSGQGVVSDITNPDQNDLDRLSSLLAESSALLDSTNTFVKVAEKLDEALVLSERLDNDTAQIRANNLYGLAYYYAGNYENATEYFFSGLELAESYGDPEYESILLNNLGMIYDEIEDYDQAIEYYQKSYDLVKDVDPSAAVDAFINQAVSYQNKKMFDKSMSLNDSAYKVAQSLNDSLHMVDILNNQGTIQYDMGNLDESLEYYLKAQQLYELMGNEEGVAIIHNNIGLIHLDRKEYADAYANFKEAERIANELNLYDFSGDIYSNLTIYYEEMEDYKNAYEYYDKYNVVYDSLIGEKRNLTIRKLEAQYNLEKNKRELLELQQKNELQQEEINQQKMRQFYMFVLVGIVILSLIIVFILLRKERKLSLELNKLNSTKDRFFSIIAHDLRNPFNSLINYTSLLKEDFERFNKKELHQIIVDLNTATEQGFKLLENLLHWSRSQTKMIKVFKTNFRLFEVCKDIIELNRTTLAEKNQTIELDGEENLSLHADKDMIATVLRNLVSNAIKFSAKGSKISIKYESDSENTVLSIKDRGIGISEKNLEQIFHLDESTSTYGTEGEKGSGLGLMICKEFIELQGGKIWVNSKVGVGSTFSFSIPKA